MKHSKTIYVLGGLVMVLGLLLTPVSVLAEMGPELVVTNAALGADQPNVAIDSKDNIHIVYSQYANSYREIWYTMLKSDGTVAIAGTMLTPDDDMDSTRPVMVIDSNDMVHIAWRDQRYDTGNDQEITYTKLNPSLDDQDGSAADAATITVVDDKQLTTLGVWYLLSVRMVIDANDDIHIVIDDYDNSNISYLKIDDTGAVVTPLTILRDTSSSWRANPVPALDSKGNVHIAFGDYEDTFYDEVYYMMISGNDASIMIDATLLTVDDSEYSKWVDIAVDEDDMVHIVYQDDAGAEKEIWYTKLNPSLDDQDGSAADDNTITVIAEKRLSPDDGVKYRHPTIVISKGSYINIAWEDATNYNLYFMILNKDGSVATNVTALTTSDGVYPITYWTMPFMAVNSLGRVHAVFSDDRTGENEIYLKTFWYPYPVGDGDGDGGGSGFCFIATLEPDNLGSAARIGLSLSVIFGMLTMIIGGIRIVVNKRRAN